MSARALFTRSRGGMLTHSIAGEPLRRREFIAGIGQHTWRVRRDIRPLLRVDGGRGDIEECASRGDALGAVGGGKEPVVTDTVEPFGQHVQ